MFQAQRLEQGESAVRPPEYFQHSEFPRFPVMHHDAGTFSALSGLAAGQIIAAMPAYNEEQYIAKIVLNARKYVDLVLVVDDGSSDATIEIAQALGALVIRHETNRGYGGTLQTIFETARVVQADALVVLDADGQHNPEDIPILLARLDDDGADVVIGSRFLKGSKGAIPAYRKIGLKVLDRLTGFAGDFTVSDTQCGFRAYGRRVIEAMQISGEGMSGGSEILIRAADAGLVIAEVPIMVRYDLPATSSQNPVAHGVSVLMNVFRLISCRRPLLFFGIPGLLFTCLGVGVGLYTFAEYFRTAQFHYVLFTGGTVSLVLGLLFLVSALVLYSLVQIMREGVGDWSAQTSKNDEQRAANEI